MAARSAARLAVLTERCGFHTAGRLAVGRFAEITATTFVATRGRATLAAIKGAFRLELARTATGIGTTGITAAEVTTAGITATGVTTAWATESLAATTTTAEAFTTTEAFTATGTT